MLMWQSRILFSLDEEMTGQDEYHTVTVANGTQQTIPGSAWMFVDAAPIRVRVAHQRNGIPPSVEKSLEF